MTESKSKEKKPETLAEKTFNRITPVVMSVTLAYLLSDLLTLPSAGEKLDLKFVIENDLWYDYQNGWTLIDSSEVVKYRILKAETVDGDLDQSEIARITDDGDCFNLTDRRGKTRHAKFLVCKKVKGA